MTTEPPPRRRMKGSAARVICSEPNTLTSTILRQTVRSTSSKLWNTSGRKALLTRTSTPPNSSPAADIRRAQASASTMLVDTAIARAPRPVTSPSTSSRFDWRRAASTRSAPVCCQRPSGLATQARADAGHHAHLARQQPGRRGPPTRRRSQSSWAKRRAGRRRGRRAIRAAVTGGWDDRRQR